MRYLIMSVANWIDENILVHGERFERIPFLWRIPSCQWVGRLELWADDGTDNFWYVEEGEHDGD